MKILIVYFKLVLLSLLALTILYGCEANDLQSMESIPTRSSPNQDVNTAYLGFEGNLHDPEVIWGNMDIYSPAYDRMVKHLKIKDNLLAWDFKSAEELNVSQNIYDYVTFIWDIDNEKLKKGEYIVESIGIYYTLTSKSSAIMPRNVPRLFHGNGLHNNLYTCMRVIKAGSAGWLGYSIDLVNSDFTSDHFGGYRFYISETNKEGKKWSAAVFCMPPRNDKDNKYNQLVSCEAYYAGNDFYEKAMNSQNAPLVTVINGHHVFK